jgi:hypothetical protein
VAGRVDEVQDIGVAVLGGVFDADGVGLDGDAALPLDIHGVEQLLLHVALGHGAGQLDQPVGERGFPVVDMGDDGEVADVGKRMAPIYHRNPVSTRGLRRVAAEKRRNNCAGFCFQAQHSVQGARIGRGCLTLLRNFRSTSTIRNETCGRR